MGRWKLSHKQRPGGLKSPSAQLALRVLLATFRSEPTPRRRFLLKKSKCRVCKNLEQRVTAIEQLVTSTPKNYALESLLKVDKKCQVLQRENAHLRLEVQKHGRNEYLIPSSPIPARDNTLAGLPAQDPHQKSRSVLPPLKRPISKRGRAKSKPERLTISGRNRTSTSELQGLSTQKQMKSNSSAQSTRITGRNSECRHPSSLPEEPNPNSRKRLGPPSTPVFRRTLEDGSSVFVRDRRIDDPRTPPPPTPLNDGRGTMAVETNSYVDRWENSDDSDDSSGYGSLVNKQAHMPRLQNQTSFPLRNPARPSMPQSPTVVTICTHSDTTLTILAGSSWDSWALRPAMRTKYNSRALHHLLACELAVLALVKGLGRSHCHIVFTLTEGAPGLMNELKFRKSMNKERRASLDRIYHWVKSAGVEAEFVHHKQGRAIPIAVPGYRSRRDRIPVSYRIPKVVTELFRRC